MPSLGADMDAGTVLEWLVAPGDVVHRGDIVAIIDTDKADIEVEIFVDGVVEELLVPVGAHVPVGTPLARVATGDEAAAPPAPTPPPEPEPSPPPEPEASPAPEPAVPALVSHSPVLRRLADHLGVDLDTVTGTGPGGRITREDVEHAAAPTARDSRQGGAGTAVVAAAEAGGGEEPSRDRNASLRQAIAALMARSKREIPHYYVSTQIDLSAALGWLERANVERPLAERLLPAALLLKAAALTAREIPELNGYWVDDAFQPAESVHLGVAVSLRGGGLVAPAIQDADQLDLTALMSALRDLVQRARAGRLRSSEMTSPTLTVTNLGDQGVEVVHGVIYPPQVALLGLGRVVERPWAEHGLLGVRPVLTATLAADHRATDGHLGARFLSTFDRHLQHPEEL